MVLPEGGHQVLGEVIVGGLGRAGATTAAAARAALCCFLEGLDAGNPLEELGFVYQSTACKNKTMKDIF